MRIIDINIFFKVIICVLFQLFIIRTYAQSYTNILQIDTLLAKADSIFLHSYEVERPLHLAEKALSLAQKIKGNKSEEYATVQYIIANIYSDQNPEKALSILEEVEEKWGNEQHCLNYAKLLGLKSYCQNIIGDKKYYQLAYENSNKSLEILNKLELTNTSLFAITLIYHAESLYNIDQYLKSLSYVDKAINLSEPKIHSDFRYLDIYCYALHVKCNILSYLGKDLSALKLSYKVVDLREKIYGKYSAPYAASLSNLATIEYECDELTLSVEHYMEAATIEEEYYGTLTFNNIYNISNLIQGSLEINNLPRARFYQQRADSIAAQMNITEDKLNFFYINVYYLAKLDYYMYLGDYNKALKLCKRCLNAINKHKFHNLIPTYLKYYSILNQSIGNYNEAYKNILDAYRYHDKLFGNIDIETFLYNLIISSFYTNRKVELETYIYQYYNIIIEDIKNKFPIYTEYQREKYIKKNGNDIFVLIPYFIDKVRTEKLNTFLYNIVLLKKGLLLRTSIDTEYIISKGSDKIKAMYENYINNSIILEHQKQMEITERDCNIDSLIIVNNSIITQISEIYPEINKSTDHLLINTNDVKYSLNTEDIAIEFIDLLDINTGDIQYKALLLKKEFNAPIIVDLFSEIDLQNIKKETMYDNSELYSLLWSPIEEYLTNIDNIYFSPSGNLSSIALESLKNSNGEIISDQYNIYRLSSTKELFIKNKKSKSLENVSLYGGLNYNSTQLDSIFRDNKISNHWNYLPGTKIEINNIKNMLVKLPKTNCIIYTDDKGTKQTLLESCSNQNLIHLATHGFFYNENLEEKKRKKNTLRLVNIGLNRPISKEEKAMKNSGIVLSGGNAFFLTDSIYSQYSNGIVTASEISQSSFDELETVVLSACETGLGEISGDGVFGLQRGFKKAGAKSILMSLWKVDDSATCLLMTHLYNNLVNGYSKAESLKRAQRQVKSEGYDSPKYWAGWIFLDALD